MASATSITNRPFRQPDSSLAYRTGLIRVEFRRLMKDSRQSLFIGGLFLAACLTVSNVLVGQAPGTFLDRDRRNTARTCPLDALDQV
jgi:hypothetical protein